MATSARPNVSDDLVWGIARTQNAFLVKRKCAGGVQFSRDPLNLVNKHSRKYAGFVNSKAVGIQAGENGGVTVTSKRPETSNKPGSNTYTATHGSGTSNRKVYKAVANRAVGGGYRADLRPEAVRRASAIRQSQRPKKDSPEKKLRGAKARKAAAEKDA
ncbi:ribosomal protein L28e [Nannizzia gypsea CBS 118893]|uniref:Ribosomal protein L28e n=1 Tax=Arthroderma gypseum (strain ATCC MYA-4604 / CBS 118893) TaxID=535722 RepID=E4UYX4_ARTGP|nr:ribosomal protein L28e [Nannizzia gypsea CBS 118893]EFR03304.1 ribosomal protein L28e [Nannizzia gypsea CBS 118893]